MANLEPHPECELSILPLPTTSTATTASVSPVNQPHQPGCNTSERFAFVTDEELAKFAEGVVPANTAKNNELGSQELSALDDQQEHLSPK